MEKELSEKKGWWPQDAELKRLHAEAAELIGSVSRTPGIRQKSKDPALPLAKERQKEPRHGQ
jgi:hypothetical protein